MNLADTLTTEVLKDQYFVDVFQKAERVNAYRLFNAEPISDLDEKEFEDLLRFADILSHSSDPSARNKAYKVVSLLASSYGHQDSFKYFSGAILAKLGNYPALQYLRENYDYVDRLPLERNAENKVKVKEQVAANGQDIFTDAQYKIRKEIETVDYFSFSGPTSIGKSFIMKDYIQHLLNSGTRIGGAIVIIVPTRALISQVASQLRKEIKNNAVNIASHPVLTSYVLKQYKEHIFIFTPERLLSYVSKATLNIKYLFVDEAQKVIAANDTRSSLYYHAIYEAVRRFACKLIFASPNIPNPDIFLKIFEKDPLGALAITDQTVAQHRYFVDISKKEFYFFSELGSKEKINATQTSWNSNDLIKDLGDGVNNIIYCNAVSETVGRAKDFAATLEDVTLTTELRELLAFIEDYVHKDYYLINCLRKGVAFHHGKMPQQIRRKVEEFFEDKESPVRYVFCTSTLLEGVNLPAKNIFVFNDCHGLQNFEKIDFENLIGRAGRLTKEFAGNVICAKDNDKRWSKGPDNLLSKVPLPSAQSFLLEKKKARKKEFSNIAKALTNEPLSKSLRVGERENLIHYASIVLLHHINDESSILKSGFLEKNELALHLLEKSQKTNRVPSEILKASSTIKPFYQNKVLRHIEKDREDSISIVNEVTDEIAYTALEVLYDLYNWEVEESGGRDPLIPPALIKANYGKSKLKYWAMLLKSWTKSEPLSRLIRSSIAYHSQKGEIWYREGGVWENERFVGNAKQINIIIEQILSDIENGLRYKIEKYFLNYYLLARHVLGSEKAGPDWSEFIEYGTTDKKNIELQNIGFSRMAAKYLLEKHRDTLIFQENELIEIKKEELMAELDKKSESYEEIIEGLK